MSTSPTDSIAARPYPGAEPLPDPEALAGATGRAPRLAFRILALVQGTLIFTIALILVPLPEIGRQMGLTSAEMLLVSVGYGLPYGGLLLFGGRLADRYGGRRVFVAGLTLFALASALAVLAADFETLVAARFLQGIAAAMVAPAAMAILQALFPSPERFGRAMAVWGGVSVLGATLAPVMSGILTNWFSWRWMFAVPIVVSLIGLAAAGRILPPARASATSRPGLDPLGAALATLGISIGSYGLVASGDHGWTSGAVFAPVLAGLALLVLFAIVERRVADPLLPPGFLAAPRRLVGLAGMLFAAAASGLVMFLLSLFLQQQWGWSTLATAGAYVPLMIALVGANHVAGRLVEAFGAGRIVVAGLVIGAAGFALLLGIDRSSSFGLGIVPGTVVLPIGMALVFAGSAVLSTADVPQNRAGLAGGVMNTAMELGPTVGLAALMAVAALRSDPVAGYALAYGTAGVAYLVLALIALPLVWRNTPARRL
ncbi:MFS transporter [Nitratireductor pacificus]|uniref:Transmembrane efflux protein n=1 Tax=Nitratireductor pacificus pht-3B TaxID=391937 RepID=K2MQL7_9HYPH|nr:MFS transporter [Nitratireductor pacificus]EKF19597.1 transmembrane efflux protein [Nitratireductor pacificus pht-3B]